MLRGFRVRRLIELLRGFAMAVREASIVRSSCAALVALLACSVSASSATPIFDPGPYLHAQRLVDIGGYRLNVYCTGTGSPTVILDAGLGGSTESWRFVQSRLARKTRTCSYDRAGMGFSDPASSQRDAGAVVSDLHALLKSAQIPAPYVLVGHSIAGLYDRLYADRYSDQVAGMVLVDPSPPDESPSGPSIYTKCAQAAENRQLIPNTPIFAECGLLTDEELHRKCDTDGPAQCRLDQLDNDQGRSPAVWKAVASEFASYSASSAEVLREQRRYGSLPLVVLTRGNIAFEQQGERTSQDDLALWKVWKSEDERIAALSSAGKDVVVSESGHDIQIDRPEAVISAVNDVVDQARLRSRNAEAARSQARRSLEALVG